MAKIRPKPAVWSMLDFSQLYDQDPQRNKERQQLALEVLNLLQQENNVAIDADTGSGKAIVALLCFLGLEYNTLFLVPTVELAYQHYELYKKLKGSADDAKVITGNKLPVKRADLWHQKNLKLVLATPQTVMSDLHRDTFPKGYFAFLVVDEFHHAHNRYAYVPIAERAHRAGLRILSLSATADDPLAQKNCFVSQVVKSNIKMPKKLFLTAVAPMTQKLKLADELCQELIMETAEELTDLKLVSPGTIWLTEHQLMNLDRLAQQTPYPENGHCLSVIGRYRELSYLRYILNLCSYQNFMRVAEGLYLKTERYANWIINHQKFNDLMAFLKSVIANEPHPKVAEFIRIARYRVDQGDTFIAFVNEKNTGRYLAEELTKQGLVVDVAFGGAERKHIKEVRHLIEANTLNGIVASSVLTEGVSLPNVDTVIHYGRPLTRVEWKQRAGRAGRGDKVGTIISVILNYPQEWAREIKTKPLAIPPKTLPRSNTLWLFPTEELLPISPVD